MTIPPTVSGGEPHGPRVSTSSRGGLGDADVDDTTSRQHLATTQVHAAEARYARARDARPSERHLPPPPTESPLPTGSPSHRVATPSSCHPSPTGRHPPIESPHPPLPDGTPPHRVATPSPQGTLRLQHGGVRRAALFYGGPEERADGMGLDTILRRRGWEVVVPDTVNHPSYDLSVVAVVERYAADVIDGQYTAVGMAPVCTSLSASLQPRVRDDQHLWGFPPERLPRRIREMTGAEYLQGHNDMLTGFFILLRAAAEAALTLDLEFWVEQPADTRPTHMPDGVTANPFYHPRGAHTAHLFRFDEWRAAVEGLDGEYLPGKQCPWGAPSPKPTWLFATKRLAVELAAWRDAECSCAFHVRLRGRDGSGQPRTRQAQAFPGPMNLCIGTGMDAACPQAIVPRSAVPHPPAQPRACSRASHDAAGTAIVPSDSEDDSDDCGSSDSEVDGDDGDGDDAPTSHSGDGELRHGLQLEPRVAQAVLAALRKPPRYASQRRLDPASPEQLRARAIPVTPATPRPHAPRRAAGQPHASAPDATQGAPYRRRPAGDLPITALFQPGVYERILAWLAAAEAAMQALTRGETAHPPSTLVITQEELQPWARGIIWDCRDPGRCTPCSPSTKDSGDDVFPGPKMDRAAYRAAADRLGMSELEAVSQAGHGGIESGAQVSLHAILAFHHTGVIDHYQAAAAVMAADLEQGFTSDSFPHPPFFPLRMGPRNIVMQDRSRLREDDPTKVEWYQKPRVTFDLSYGVRRDATGPPPSAPKLERYLVAPPNLAIPREATTVALPTITDFGESVAVVGDLARDEPGVDVEGACIDVSNAYSFLLQQRLDWWLHCFLWVGGVRHSRRVVFGGAFGPQAWCSVMAVPHADIAAEIAAVERVHPPPPSVRAACAERGRLQHRGELPAGPEQTRAWALQWFLDDGQLAALNDRVPTPPHLARIETGHVANTVAHGGRPSQEGTRVLCYLRIMVHVLQRLGFEVAITKTQAGTVIVVLGARTMVAARRIDMPPARQAAILADVRTAHADAVAGVVHRVPVTKLVGRLVHVSQLEPSILTWLSAGYAVVTVRSRRRRFQPTRVHLRQDGRRQRELLALLEMAEEAVAANVGIAMATAEFPRHGVAGSVLSVTDASLQPLAAADAADDGVGGFGFAADWPDLVFVFSVPWPRDIRSALVRGTLTAASRPAGPVTSMPVAETLGSLALPLAIQLWRPVTSVIAVGDCSPSASAITAANSASAQIRALLRPMLAITPRWTGVAVPREWNTDPDRLSHPSRLSEVLRDVPPGLTPRVITPAELEQAGLWEAMRTAMALPPARTERSAAAAAERLQIGKHGWTTAGSSSPVSVMRPSPAGNPFSVMRRGRLVEAWRDAVCDAFEAAVVAVVAGRELCLEDIAREHGLPPGSVREPYASQTGDEYAGNLWAAIQSIRERVRAGEELTLTCACLPRRCHATTLRRAICVDCD